jgi:hypothetical protein
MSWVQIATVEPQHPTAGHHYPLNLDAAPDEGAPTPERTLT